MPEIKIQVNDLPSATSILKELLDLETKRLEYGLELSNNRLSIFEKKYYVPSMEFVKKWAAEDLEGTDMLCGRLISWASQFRLRHSR